MLFVSRLEVELLFSFERNLLIVRNWSKFVELNDVVVEAVLDVSHNDNSLAHFSVLVSKHNCCQCLSRTSGIFEEQSMRIVVQQKGRHYLVKFTEQLTPHKLGAHVSGKTLIKFFSEHHFWRQKNGLNSLLVSILSFRH
jgi:hypothetical protein